MTSAVFMINGDAILNNEGLSSNVGLISVPVGRFSGGSDERLAVGSRAMCSWALFTFAKDYLNKHARRFLHNLLFSSLKKIERNC